MSCRFFTCDTDYCDKTRSCDDMLEQFEKDRKEVVNILKKNDLQNNITKVLWSHNSPISKDGNCLFKMGKELKLSIEDMLEKNCEAHTLFNYYICPQCKNLRRLIDFAETGPNIPFQLQCGAQAGSFLYYEEIPSPNTSVYFSSSPYEGTFLFADDFTKNFLINWYLTEGHHGTGNTGNKNVSMNLQKLYISFICNSNGYNLYEYCELADIGIFQDNVELLSDNGRPSPTSKPDDKTPLKREIANGILRQLICLLHYLSKSNFSYEGFKLSNLKFKKLPASYHYEGLHVTSPITLKLTHLEKSACNVNKVRLCHKSIIEDENLLQNNKKGRKGKKGGKDEEKWKGEGIGTFKVPNKLKDKRLFMYMKNLGMLNYAGSFDLYAFFVMLMTDRAFYSAVMTDKNLYTLWKSLWTEKSLEIITNRVMTYHDQSKIPDTQDQVLELVSNVDLFTDALQIAFKGLY